MTMRKTSFILVSTVALSSLILTGCGKSSDGANTSAGNATNLTENAEASTSTAFGASLKLGSNVTLLLSTPANFKPTVFASNFQQGWVANKIEVTLTNNGKTALEPSAIAFATKSGENVCTDILDGDNGINGAPTTALAAGASETFLIGVGCDAKAGAPLEITATIGTDIVAVKGTLA
jgi:hypothetical protein